ncbi:MAG: phosphonopyruvate decarboxylase [Paludibacteraceae bacterium]|nr:phosphonopyruvate decarboxylase [Paludibacteraceae bacterium]
MINPESFIHQLSAAGINLYVGVPDSLLKSVCAYLTDHFDASHNVIAANEGAAIGLASGHYLATGHPACVYMQNSGLGNAVNPLLSLADADVYQLPVLLVVGWRGEPGVHDEPQHVKQGKLTLPLLQTMGIAHGVLSHDESAAAVQIQTAVDYMLRNRQPYALVVQKGTFSDYQPSSAGRPVAPEMRREEAIRLIVDNIGQDAVIVSTTGMISRELFEIREALHQGHQHDFLTVGSMGHASQIALGIALARPERTVYCLDGDGACIMHMGSLGIVGQLQPQNLVHIVLNNGAHDSVGGQPTVGLDIDLTAIATACGYQYVERVTHGEQLADALFNAQHNFRPAFIEVQVSKGARKDLGRPTTTPRQNRDALMDNLRAGQTGPDGEQ